MDLSYYVRITEEYSGLSSAIRVLIIDAGVETLYMKEDTVEKDYSRWMPQAEYFLTSATVMRKVIPDFNPGEIRAFSIVIWLEGYDPDTTDDILGGMIKMTMNFTINGFE